MSLTKHFTLEELTASDIAARHGIDNTPTSPLILTNLKTLAEGLEHVRTLLGKPVIINSGYRSVMVNSLLGTLVLMMMAFREASNSRVEWYSLVTYLKIRLVRLLGHEQ